ncbi:aspartate aminotransferase family protein [bacterium]|nr:aspartate aminotransferase family protein [bacterium]
MTHEASTVLSECAHTAGTYRKRDVAIVRGEGVWVYDEAGRKYLDAIGGIGANVLGHRHPYFSTELKSQIDLTLSVPELLCNNTRAEYQSALLSLFPPCYDRVFLCNGGAEANEAALKFARVLSQKTPLVALNFGYHGKTLGALSVTHNPKYREPFEPLYHPVHFLPQGNIERLNEVFDGDPPAAFIFEGVQGEGGVRTPESEYVKTVSHRVQEGGGYVIADEVQCGFGRTGRWWGFEAHGVEPDFVVLGKAIGNGVPLSAVVLHKRVGQLPPLAHTTTFGGNPLSCRAGLATIEVMKQESLVEQAAQRGEQFRHLLREARLSNVRELRGEGLMIGVELKERAGRYLAELQQEGVLALLAGPRVLRALPPYVISEDEMNFLAGRFIEVLRNEKN